MEANKMTFTTGQIITIFIAFIGLILTVLNIIDKSIILKKNADAPFKELERRVTTLEIKLEEANQSLKKGNDIFRKQEKINTMFERIQLAFVDFEVAYCHSQGYTDTESLIKAKSLLEKLLTNDDEE